MMIRQVSITKKMIGRYLANQIEVVAIDLTSERCVVLIQGTGRDLVGEAVSFPRWAFRFKVISCMAQAKDNVIHKAIPPP